MRPLDRFALPSQGTPSKPRKGEDDWKDEKLFPRTGNGVICTKCGQEKCECEKERAK
jgi:hypothetical protein